MTPSSRTRLVSLDAATFRKKGFGDRIDPLTLEPFKVGDTARICVKCDAAFLEDSWNSAGSVCGCFADNQKIDLRRGRQGVDPAAGADFLKRLLAALLILAIAYLVLRSFS